MSAALLAGVLVTGGVFLVLQRGLTRVLLGFVLLGHAVNVLLLAAGGLDRREPPLVDRSPVGQSADPLPQAFALTAIVITFAITVYLFALALAGAEASGDDDTEDTEDTEDTDTAAGGDSGEAAVP